MITGSDTADLKHNLAGGVDAESTAFDRIIDRLRASYPELDGTAITLVVQDAVRDLDGGRLRQYVPLLVEKVARDTCRHRQNRHSEQAEA